MKYVFLIDPRGAEPEYYAGLKRHGLQRKADFTVVNHPERALTFDTAEEADAFRRGLAGGY
jgi:hypothetical protein